MNLRQQKRVKLSLMHFGLFGPHGPIGQWLPSRGLELVKLFREAAGIDQPTGKTFLNVNDVAVSVPIDTQTSGLKKYVVVKKSTGETVGEFDTIDDAQAIIDKAKRAKKAALALLNEDHVQ